MTPQEREFLALNDLWATHYEEFGPHHSWTKRNESDVAIALLFLGGYEE